MYDRKKVLKPAFVLRTVSTGPNTEPEHNIFDGKDGLGEPFQVMRFVNKPVAENHLAWLQAMHADGRAAHTTCEHGPCDWRRLTEPRRAPPDVLKRVVLCDEHGKLINALQIPKAVA